MAKSNDKQITLLVDQGIPMPVERKERKPESQARINWPFANMSHGDSFLLPVDYEKKKAYSALSALKRRGKIDKAASIVTQLQDKQYSPR